MTRDTNIKLFENKKVRSVWDAETEKMQAADGKFYKTDVADVDRGKNGKENRQPFECKIAQNNRTQQNIIYQ